MRHLFLLHFQLLVLQSDQLELHTMTIHINFYKFVPNIPKSIYFIQSISILFPFLYGDNLNIKTLIQ